MAGANGLLIPSNWPGAWYLYAGLQKIGFTAQLGVPLSQFDPNGVSPYWIISLLGIAWLMPNTQQLMARYAPALETVTAAPGGPIWRPNLGWAVVTGICAATAMLHLTQVSEFLYFQF